MGRREVFARVNFPELTQIALLGTERQSISATAANTPLGQLQSKVDVNQREGALLSLAALSALHERIGRLPAQDKTPSPSPCPVEKQPRVSERAGSLLLRLLGGEHAEILPEWLKLAAQAAQLAPPEAMPALLNLGAPKPEFHEAILPVLGERGRWLAVQNSEWAWVAGVTNDDEILWQTEDSSARLLFLQRLRKANPTRARELLLSTWQTESPEDRAAFITALGIGLTPEDEAFLEAALDDKRKEVRRAAATLLAQLPESALVKRMIERVRPLLKFVPGESGSLLRLKKGKPASLEIILPAECDKLMQRDGIDPKPLPGYGEKAGWLMQMLEAVPLAFWTTEWKVAADEIISASAECEWRDAMFEAWVRAAARQKVQAWAEALLVIAVQSRHISKFDELTAAVRASHSEKLFGAALDADDGKTSGIQEPMLTHSRHNWSVEFSRTVLKWLRKKATIESTEWQLRNQLKVFALRLAPEVLAEAATGWPAEGKAWEFWSKGVDEFLAVAQFRAEVRAAFKTQR
jgi:hypothetical protein